MRSRAQREHDLLRETNTRPEEKTPKGMAHFVGKRRRRAGVSADLGRSWSATGLAATIPRRTITALTSGYRSTVRAFFEIDNVIGNNRNVDRLFHKNQL
ncbi:MAG TPA: hypothetical protein VNL74_02760 [Methylococcus sp.]|nr:hypothetical protein [Methylococcus sp.]